MNGRIGLVFAPVVRQSVQEASSGFQLGYDFVGIGVLQVSLSIPPDLYVSSFEDVSFLRVFKWSC
eukprot:snap_masked-scaffold_3-processed-gene-2.29-mRNA-1 protein AED:1.00 eAED:1.00 QI:0/0/0/0/1/1/2/0/64